MTIEVAPSIEPGATVTVRGRRLIAALLVVTACLVVASVAVVIARDVFGHEHLLGLVGMFDMNREANMSSWFSGALLLGCAAAFALGWLASQQESDADARHWAALAILFTAASADEVTGIHEAVGSALNDGGTAYVYLVPGVVLLLGVALAMRRFFDELPEPTRRSLGAGIATWVFGAVGLEAFEMLVYDGGEPQLGVSLLATAEDLFELLGLILILHALIGHASAERYRTTLRFERS